MTFRVTHRPVRTYLNWLVLACLLPGVIGAAALFVYQYHHGRAEQKNSMILATRALAQAIDNDILKVQAVAETLAQSEILARRDFSSFHRHAREVLVRVGLGNNVVLTDRDYRQLLNTAVEYGTVLPPRNNRDQVKRVFDTGKPAVSDVIVGSVIKRPVITIDVPVMLEGKVAYTLGIVMVPENFNAILQAQKLPPVWIAAVFDSSGTIAARTLSPEKFVGRKANPRLRQAMTEISEGSIESTTLDGIEVRSFFSRAPATNWRVAIGISREALALELVRPIALLAAGVIALFALGAALAWLMGGRIAHSIRALISPAVALGEGRSAPIPQVDVKEAAEVATAIGRAADFLKVKETQLNDAHLLAGFATWSWDLKTNQVVCSDSMPQICGRDIPAFPEQRGTLLTHESWEHVNAAMQEALRTGKGYDLEIQVIHGNGTPRWMNAICEPVRNAQGEVVALRGMLQDIDERKQAEQRVRDASLHDSLTGLPNRALVMDYCERLLAAAQRGHGRGAFLFIDLDRFKPINDTYGHETGDHVLKEVGKRLRSCTRHEDLVGRLGGDEFVIVLPHIDGDHQRARTVAQHVVDSISRPFRINALELSISPSIGISYFTEHATDVSTLIHTADLAMYQAKQSGRGNYQIYTPELELQAVLANSLEGRLRNALKSGSLALYYQPVIDIKSGKPIGAEALLRLDDNDGVPIGPDRFIPVAESTGLIGQLGEWVAAEACRQQEAWARQGMAVTVAINVSPLQFRQPAFAEKLGRIIADAGADPSSLEIEVTESAIMENVDDAVAILNRIKSLGVKIALDDFGVGYSSLASLTSLPLDKLKVDRSFVRDIERDQASRAVTEAILALGHRLKLDVHGEGIESENALHYLEEHGCDQAQGYWFCRPLPPTEFVDWYHAHAEAGDDTKSRGRVKRNFSPRE